LNYAYVRNRHEEALSEDVRLAERFMDKYLTHDLSLREDEQFKFAFFDMENGYVLRVLTEATAINPGDPPRSFYMLTYHKDEAGALHEREPGFWDTFLKPKARFVYAATGYNGLRDEMAFYASWALEPNHAIVLAEPGVAAIPYSRFLGDETDFLSGKKPEKEPEKKSLMQKVMGDDGALTAMRRKLTSASLRRHIAVFNALDDANETSRAADDTNRVG
jgi:hypothetical protein